MSKVEIILAAVKRALDEVMVPMGDQYGAWETSLAEDHKRAILAAVARELETA